MSAFRKLISFIMIIITIAVPAFMLVSCTEEEESGTFLVYYTNSETEADDIIYHAWKIENSFDMETTDLAQELFRKMFETDMSVENLYSAKPDEVNINEFFIKDNLITIDFDEHYRELSNVQEILLRAAVVLTIIQLPGVTQVQFTVDTEPLTDSSGKRIGTMNASNFVNILLTEEGMLKQETDLTIYFTDETGSVLIPAPYHFTISNNNTSMEEYILQQLKAGPAIESTYRTMAANVEILSVVTSDDVCYVNFGSNFLEQEQPASDEILIYSIVNSLCSLTYVSSVQFLVDGSSDVMLHTMMDLSKPFTRNRDLEQK